MPHRIPLDSPVWDTDQWSGVDDPRSGLQRILQEANPDSTDIDYVLDGTFYVDTPAPHFYYMLPYLLDIFDAHPIPSSIRLFCTYLHRARDGNPSDRCLEQLDLSRPRIASLLIRLLQTECDYRKSTYADCKWILAGLATACDQSDLGRQIIGIDDNQYIN